jgi:transglutaminase-like putative cysteine protease
MTLALPFAGCGGPASDARADWRTFDVRVQVNVLGARGPVRLWLPLPLTRQTSYQRDLGSTWQSNGATTTATESAGGAALLMADWTNATDDPSIELIMRMATRDVAVPLDRSRPAPPEDLTPYLRPTALIPTDGIVRDTAAHITRGHQSDLSRARAIYDWIVEHTVRDPDVRGCGLGDIRWMLETKNLAGKCADLNALFVGLARASSLPARDLYGLRVGPSTRFTSLGRAGDVTAAQHCRAEVHLRDFGWVPVDPADVRKVILEERPDGALTDAHVIDARERLFGSWEMNWIAFNDAHDVVLPGSAGPPLPFLMYPQAEAGGVRRDSLDPATFHYRITAAGV